MIGHMRPRQNHWEGVFDIGPDPETGKRRQRWISAPTQEELREKLRQALADIAELDAALTDQMGQASTSCPRCGGTLYEGSYEPECLQCGWADYSHAASKAKVTELTGQFLLRFVGEEPRWKETVIKAQVYRNGVYIKTRLWCPYPDCQLPMERGPIQGGTERQRLQTYWCEGGHDVKVVLDRNREATGWR